MSKLYGSLDNRFNENKNFTHRDIQVGDDITMYWWSDRTCYYITKVINQKHIFVKKYCIIADHHKPGGIGHQDWIYFKTCKEEQEYTNRCVEEGLLPDYCKHNLSEIQEYSEEEWVFRYNHWYSISYRNGVKIYTRLQPISFGVRDYYYDWEF